MTLATVPVVVDPFTVYTTSATVGWDGNGNPVDTEYVVRMSANSISRVRLPRWNTRRGFIRRRSRR
ncbi:MAG: hypothetical protein IPN19_02435 [Elusimicrobia bacterium]|nr:hypothetical protein [Elusimicrobiota bacterium]